MSRYHWNPKPRGKREALAPSLESEIRYFRNSTRAHRRYIVTTTRTLEILEAKGRTVEAEQRRCQLGKLHNDHAEHLAAFRHAVRRLRERRQAA